MKTSDALYTITVYVQGKKRKLRVFSPRGAFCRLESWLSAIRPSLIQQADQVLHDWPLAEDMVQKALLNAYRHLNNASLHAVKLPEKGYLLVRGGVESEAHHQWDEKIVNRWLRQGKEEVPQIEVIEELEQWLRTIVRREAYNYWNKRKKFLHFWQDHTGILSVADFQFESAEHNVLRDERDEELRAFVAALPPEFRDIVQLKYWG